MKKNIPQNYYGMSDISGGDEGLANADLAKSPAVTGVIPPFCCGSNPFVGFESRGISGTKIKRPQWAFDFCGGDEGIRTLDTVAGILHFQCSALDQLCDVSGFRWSDYSADKSAVVSVCCGSTGSSTNAFSNSASISRNNGSSVAPTSNDSSPDSTAGVSLYD